MDHPVSSWEGEAAIFTSGGIDESSATEAAWCLMSTRLAAGRPAVDSQRSFREASSHFEAFVTVGSVACSRL